MEPLPLIHYTPPAKYLLPFLQLHCNVNDCGAVFTNKANLMMHIQRHHRLTRIPKKKNNIMLFYCPEKSCRYNISTQNGKSFKCLKYLRQHFQKVHAEKTYACNKCENKFLTKGLLKSHQQQSCGKQFTCFQCELKFGHRPALLMHIKRKGHEIQQLHCGLKMIPRLNRKIETVKKSRRQTETAAAKNNVQDAVMQTDELIISRDDLILPNGATESCMTSSATDAVDFTSLLCDIETQTEIPISHNNSPLDQMLSNSSNMHTQTCDEFLSELGLSDIQTQTNWSSLDSNSKNHDVHDDMFVSTETQTSFAHCLLDDSTEIALSALCNTQHTQTCDTLLEGLFGAQGSDLIGAFQSTYTQT